MTSNPTCGLMPCQCGAGTGSPPLMRDLATLSLFEPGARVLEADAETLALVLPVFGRAIATTVGPHALLSETGGYGRAEMAGHPAREGTGRIALRLVSGRGERVVYSPAAPARRRPAVLHLADASGRIAHRAEIAAPEDILCLGAMIGELGPAPLGARKYPAPTRCLPSLPAIRQARSAWGQAPGHRHRDDFLFDEGAQRRHCLPHLGHGAATRVAVPALPALFERLFAARLPFQRAVPRAGCLQSQSGALDDLDMAGLCILRSGAGLMALDLRGVADCWLTRVADGATMLELYDAEGRCIALFAAAQGHRLDWESAVRGLAPL